MNLYDSILITGAGGMLGHALHDSLSRRGKAPKALARGDCDIASDAGLSQIAAMKPTLVLNCAAHTKVDLCEQEPAKADAINGHAVGRLAEICKQSGAMLVHVSTDFVFDGTSRSPYRANDPVHPLSAYGRSKLLGEQLIQQSGLHDWLIVRTAWVYGRHGANFPRTIISAARAGKPLSVVSDQIGSPTYAADLADAILALLDAKVHGIWHVTNSGQTSWFEFAKAALAEFGLPNEVTPVTSADWQKLRPSSAARPGYSVLELEPFAKATGKPMRPWRAALADYLAAVEREGF